MSGAAKGASYGAPHLDKAELERFRVLQEVQRGFRRQRDAAMELGVSERQLRRLLRGLEAQGAASVPSKKRVKAPNNRISDDLRLRVLERCRSDYRGFGPTFLAETLAARDGIEVSAEWLRALLVENALWTTKRRKRNVHPLRARRPRFGELVQMDGSPHDWFEERGPRCTLLLAIDDATSRITSARFENAETTDGYMLLIRKHLDLRPLHAAYKDKHSIFRYSGQSASNNITTQWQRSLDELEIELICANSPQAKGRVERANRTFQDRLIKAMRLEGIGSTARGNGFLPHFLTEHNARFAIAPESADDAHRDLGELDLNNILCRREERVVTKNLMFQVDDAAFALVDSYSRLNLCAGSRLQIHLHPDGRMTVYHETQLLENQQVAKLVRSAPIVGAKDLNAHLDRRVPNPAKAHTPAINHPWRRS
jgi:transposase